MKKHFSIAIDGPGGAGKSTLAKAVAKKLNILHVDTGAIYRTIGYAAFSKGVDPKDGEAAAALLPELEIGMRYEADGEQHMLLNGQDVTREIRLPEISMYASAVSALPAVRAFLLEMQRDLARKHSVIMDGRDIGTVVFPHAQVKIFLTASVKERAMRRYKEMLAKGEKVDLAELEKQIAFRDKQDSEREIAPLKQADDAEFLDTSDMTIDEVAEHILKAVQEK